MLRFNATEALKYVDKAQEVLRQSADDIFSISQDLVAVDKGLLKASGQVVQETPNRVVVGYGGEGSGREGVAPLIEWGTSQMEAQPFLTPSFAQAPSIIDARAREKMK